MSARLVAKIRAKAGLKPASRVRNRVEPDQVFGRLTVIADAGRRAGKRMVRCACSCGTVSEVYIGHLVAGASQACGRCRAKHGLAGHDLYSRWHAMMDRCGDPDHHAYRNYGGRGIAVDGALRTITGYVDCVEALPLPAGCGYAGCTLADLDAEQRAAFLRGYTIDRADNERGYEPGNLRWASWPQQAANRRPGSGVRDSLGRWIANDARLQRMAADEAVVRVGEAPAAADDLAVDGGGEDYGEGDGTRVTITAHYDLPPWMLGR